MTYRDHAGMPNGASTYLLANAYARAQPNMMRGVDGQEEQRFTIAISRETGVDAAAVAHNVSERLGWPVWDHELLVAIAERLHAKTSDLTPIDEKHVPWLQESVESLLDMHMVSQMAYVHQLVKVFDSLSEQGNCIIVGRGAAHALPVDSTLRVRLVAPIGDRMVALRRVLGADRDNHLQKRIYKMDRDQARFVRDHFHKDPNDPTNYDVVLNMSRLSIDDCGQQIVDALHAEQAQRAGRFHLVAQPQARAM